MNLDNTYNRLQTLSEYIDDTEDYIRFEIDTQRNRFIEVGPSSAGCGSLEISVCFLATPFLKCSILATELDIVMQCMREPRPVCARAHPPIIFQGLWGHTGQGMIRQSMICCCCEVQSLHILSERVCKSCG